MTDPVEDRLRDHFADRAARVTATPDPGAFVNRSVGRARPATALLTGLVVAVVVLVAGGFGTGLAVAGSGTPSAPRTPASTPAVGPGPSVSAGSVAGTEVPSGTATMAALTPLFNRTTGSGVTIRAYTASVVSGCGSGTACPPIRVTPAPVPCPSDAMCVQPANPPVSAGGGTSGAGTGATTGSGGSAASTGTPTNATGTNGTTTGTASTGTTTGTGTVSTLPTGTGCQALTLELSTDLAVTTAQVAVPASPTGTGTGVTVLGSGTFGAPEGGPAGWIAVQVGAGVSAVHLVSSSGTVVDAMTPTSGVAVLASTALTGGTDPLSGLTVVGLGPSGATVASTPVAQVAGASPAQVCLSVPPLRPIVTPTTSTTLPTAHPTPLPTTPVTSTPDVPSTRAPAVPVAGTG